MCGISGIVTAQPSLLAQSIHSMTQRIRHRGPDDEGYVMINPQDSFIQIAGGDDTPSNVYTAKTAYTPQTAFLNQQIPAQIAFGHRRLKIIGEANTAHQPICSPCQRFWMVYNGMLYNQDNLRIQLKETGYHFLTDSDAEVVLAAYIKWGENCLSKLNGMFAFVIYDQKTQLIFAARDRFGIKPLYYTKLSNGGIAFASEIKQFHALSNWTAQLNHQSLYDFLNWRLLNHTSETMLQNVSSLPAGSYLTASVHNPEGSYQIKKWYQIQTTVFQGSFNEACQIWHDLFFQVIQEHLQSNLSIGYNFSGGIDSSSIVCIADQCFKKQQNSNPLQLFYADCNQYDEGPFIKAVLKHINSSLHNIIPDAQSFFLNLSKIIWQQDQPLTTSSIFAQWLLFKKAQEEKISVVLDGQGADEYLWGYHDIFGAFLSHQLLQNQFKTFKTEIMRIKSLYHYSWYFLLQLMGNILLPEKLRQCGRKMTHHSKIKPEWLDFKKMNAEPKDPYLQAGQRTDDLQQYTLAQINSSSLPNLLHIIDRNSMVHSIEARVPFLDHRLVEFAFSLPNDYKIKDGVTKKNLRESLKNVLPKIIYQRTDKQGFPTPEKNWLCANPQQLQSLFQQGLDLIPGIIPEKANRYLDLMLNKKRAWNHFPLAVISFGIWAQQIFNKK